MVRLQDVFPRITSMGNGPRQLWTLMTNRQLVVWWTWSKISKTWCWDITGNGNGEKSCLKTAFCKTLSNIINGGRFWCEAAGVAPVMPWSMKLRLCLLLKTIPASWVPWTSWQTKFMPFSVSPDFMECLKWMFLGKESLALILPDTNPHKDNEKGPRTRYLS